MDLSTLSLVTPFLKDFPIEIYNEILKFCDPSTLANTSRVSLAFLELSSPLLYRDVKLVGFEQMGKLFCVRKVRPSCLVCWVSEKTESGAHRPPSLPSPSPPNPSSSITSPSIKSEPSLSSLPVHLLASPLSRWIDLLTFDPWKSTSSRLSSQTTPRSHLTSSIPPSRASWLPLLPRCPCPESWAASEVETRRRSCVPRSLPSSGLSNLILRDSSPQLHRDADPSSSRLASLCISDAQANELQVAFEGSRLPLHYVPLSTREQARVFGFGRMHGEEEMIGIRCFLLDGLADLLIGSRAVKAVVIRVVEEEEEYMEREAVSRMGRGAVERLKREQKLRFEVWEE